MRVVDAIHATASLRLGQIGIDTRQALYYSEIF